MKGCERCGAQAPAAETACPVCGLALRTARPADPIPVRRHGTVPRPPMELMVPADAAGAVSVAALGLGALGTALIAAGIGYLLW